MRLQAYHMNNIDMCNQLLDIYIYIEREREREREM